MQFSESLKKNHQFRFVYKNGRSYANKYFIMYVKENGLDKNRIGISVSKKVGNSVVRHRITRLVRESYRLHESVFNSGLDMVIIARPAAASIGYEEAESALLHLAKLHHLIKIYFYQMVKFCKMQQRTLRFFISYGSCGRSCNDYHIQTTIEYTFM